MYPTTTVYSSYYPGTYSYVPYTTSYYSYPVPQTIAFITRYHSLWPGDVISMGTAFRPGKTGRRSLHTANITELGGPVRVSITGLGVLENPVRRIIGGKTIDG